MEDLQGDFWPIMASKINDHLERILQNQGELKAKLKREVARTYEVQA